MFKTIDADAGFNSGGRLSRALAAIRDNFLALTGITASAAAAYTLKTTDRIVRRTGAAAQTTTVPTNATAAFDIGTVILIEQAGAGANTIAAAAGVTINKLAAKGLGSAGQFGVVRLVKMDTNVWSASGDLGAA